MSEAVTPKRIIVVGGSAAGPKAAARARRFDQNAEIILIQKGDAFSMASCGYPYYVGGFFDDRNMLLSTPTGVVRDPVFFLKAKAIDARARTEVVAIDREKRKVACLSLENGEEYELEYDKLIIATGATARMPPIPGVELEGVTSLQSLPDADRLRQIRDEGKIRKAVIVGGGLIGIETCEALQLAGIEITVIELLPQILTFLDWELAKLLENHVKSKAANVITDCGATEFLGENGRLTGVRLSNGAELPCELAVVAIGVKPNVELASRSGIELGSTGGIKIDEFTRTNDPNVYAIGDCVETVNRLSGQPTLAPYGDLANLQGRVAGSNAATGDRATFPGTINTGICKVFDYSAGSTGLSPKRTVEAGFDPESIVIASPDKPHFMGGKLLVSKLTADRKTGRILGFQCLGPGDVGRQVAVAAMAIMGNQTVTDLTNADLPYAPPFSLAIDHIINAAHALENKVNGLFQSVSCSEVRRKVDEGKKPFMLDVRSPGEFETTRLGVEEKLIPLGALRERLDMLPDDKDAEIICYCKISLRGYEAARVLQAKGWRNVKVMEGGVMAWPFPKEK